MKTLVIGYGNPGRLDDGLGPSFAEGLASRDLPGVAVDSDYQLSIEDAEAASRFDAVVFVDASVSCAEPFEFRVLEPASEMSFTTHDVSPGAVLALAWRLFGSSVRGYTLAIRGYEFDEFGERLSARAVANRGAALEFLVSALARGALETAAGV